MSLSSQETCAAIYKQLFTDAEWQIIDYALSEYQDHLDEDDNEIEIYNSIQAKLNANTAIRQRKYIQLRQLIQEMDVWNYAIQTSKHASTPYDRANHTNFSALGISRDPSDYNTPFGIRKLATYGLMGGTKPTSCYPRWMAHTWSAMKVVENMPSFDEAQLNAAVDLNVLLFNESRPTTQQMLIFSNTQSILASAQQNRAQLANASPQQKLQILLDTVTNIIFFSKLSLFFCVVFRNSNYNTI